MDGITKLIPYANTAMMLSIKRVGQSTKYFYKPIPRYAGQSRRISNCSSDTSFTKRDEDMKASTRHAIGIGRMRAWQINAYGNTSQLELNDTNAPRILHPNDVLVRVHAASINPIDTQMLGGYGNVLLNQTRKLAEICAEKRTNFPIILGRDCSGVVEVTGKGVVPSRLKPGDKVWAAVNPINQGTFADYVVCSSSELSKRPHTLCDTDAASLPYVAATTWMALSTIGRLTPKTANDKRVLILGGGGGIGTFAVQLLRAWGAQVVCTCAAEDNDLLVSLGAHHTVDYHGDDMFTELRLLERFDVILNATPTEQRDMMEVLRVGGQYVTLVTPLLANNDRFGVALGTSLSALSLGCDVAKGLGQGKHYRWALFQPNGQALAAVAKLVDEGQIKSSVNQVFAFCDLPKAIEKVSAGHNRGKTVVDMMTDG